MKSRHFFYSGVALCLGFLALSVQAQTFYRAPHEPHFPQGGQNPGSSQLTPIQAPASEGDIGRWHLVRTPGPEKSDIVSIMHTADALKSDPDFAGLVIRCRPKSRLQIAVVTVRPFPPRAHPQLSVTAGSARVTFQASVIPPGSMLSLPDEAEVLAKGPWQSVSQLAIDIKGNGEEIRGVVPVDNLKNAIAFLQRNCQEH